MSKFFLVCLVIVLTGPSCTFLNSNYVECHKKTFLNILLAIKDDRADSLFEYMIWPNEIRKDDFFQHNLRNLTNVLAVEDLNIQNISRTPLSDQYTGDDSVIYYVYVIDSSSMKNIYVNFLKSDCKKIGIIGFTKL